MTYRHERRCRTGTALMAGGMALAASAFGHAQPGYEFDDRLLLGSSLGGGDLSRFNQDGRIDPGRYHVDVYLNERFASRSEVSFLANPASGAVEPCLEEDFLRQRLGAKPGDDPRKSGDGRHCAFLGARLPGSRFSLDVARLRLDLSVPQALLDLKPRGYVSPEEWDAGDSMGFVNYDTNLYRSDYRGGESGRSDYAYVGLNSGINLGLWRLRHQSNYTYSRYNGQARRKWNSIRTYAQRALPAWRSELTAGESYTAGNLLGSIGYRGLSLATDDRMLPESLRRYAPQVRGTAATAARVVISQNGRKIREVNVAPGPFVIDDLYDSAYAGDLDVQVFEADGSVSSFSVPFASVPESMRPGLSRYSFTLGQARQYGDGDDLFADFTYQRGMSNALTANLGLRVADDYLAMLGGGVLATRFGAFGLNSTYSSARVEDGARKQGWRIGLDYSRTFQPTGTTLTLAGYRYSTEGYRELGDVLGSRDALRHGGHLGFRQLQAAQPVQPAGEPGPRRLRQPLSFRLLQRFLRRQEPRHPIAVRLLQHLGAVELQPRLVAADHHLLPGAGRPGPWRRAAPARPAQRPAQRHPDPQRLHAAGFFQSGADAQRHSYPALRRQRWRQPANRAERYAGRRAYLELRAVRQPRQRGRRHHLERHVAEAGGAGHRECRLCPRAIATGNTAAASVARWSPTATG
ncbi:usher [Pseudomonas aeruginosa]|nr:usher [Pseudomonas aeruginosa]